MRTRLPDTLAGETREIAETSMAFVLDGDEIVYVAGVQARKLVAVQVRYGTRVAAYASPVGRVLLAELSTTELDRYFADVELVRLTEHTIDDETELLLVRDISYTETAALAKEAEEALQYRDMQRDIVQQVMRRLAAVRLP